MLKVKGFAASIGLIALLSCATFNKFHYINSSIQRAQNISVYEATYAPSGTETQQVAWDVLVKRLESWGWAVEVIPDNGMFWGATVWLERKIVINASAKLDGRVEILVHEIGHVLMPATLRAEGNYNIAEVFAELVGQGIARELGFDVSGNSENYMANLKHAFPSVEFMKEDILVAIDIGNGKRGIPIFQ